MNNLDIRMMNNLEGKLLEKSDENTEKDIPVMSRSWSIYNISYRWDLVSWYNIFNLIEYVKEKCSIDPAEWINRWL